MTKNQYIYWISTTLFCLILLLDGIGGLTHQQAGVDVLKHLGYPEYLLDIKGVATICASVAIFQNRYKTIKEWAFAGWGIVCYGAFSSRLIVGDTGLDLIFPLIFAGFMIVPYIYWKKLK